MLAAVFEHMPILDEDDAIDLGGDVLKEMGDKDERAPALRYPPHGLANVIHAARIEPCARLVGDERLWVVHERTGNEDAPCLSRRERHHIAILQVSYPKLLHDRSCSMFLLGRDVLAQRDPERAEESSFDDLYGRKMHGDLRLHRRGDDADVASDLFQGCASISKEEHGRQVSMQRKHLPCHHLDEGRFASSVRTKDGNRFALREGKVIDAQDLSSRAHDSGIAKSNERWALAFHGVRMNGESSYLLVEDDAVKACKGRFLSNRLPFVAVEDIVDRERLGIDLGVVQHVHHALCDKSGERVGIHVGQGGI